jgi:DNA polymerase-3 subunit epsilon
MAKVKQIIQKLEATGKYRVLHQLQKVSSFHEDENVKKKIGIVLDVETTGFDPKNDKIIELGMILFEYSIEDGRIFNIIKEFNQLEDPEIPIPDSVVAITGITDDDVKNKAFDDHQVETLVSKADLVIAHNASFDRPFVEKRFPIFCFKNWACSHKQLGWADEGITGSKLEYLAFCFKFFFTPHRAIDDCWALLKILSCELPVSGELALKSLLTKAKNSTFLIEAVGAPFAMKDTLKSRGYHWNNESRCWGKEFAEDEVQDEKKFLQNVVYEGSNAGFEITELNGMNRFK